MQTLYTNNTAGAFAAARDYWMTGLAAESEKRKAWIKGVFAELSVAGVRELSSRQLSVFIYRLGFEVFYG